MRTEVTDAVEHAAAAAQLQGLVRFLPQEQAAAVRYALGEPEQVAVVDFDDGWRQWSWRGTDYACGWLIRLNRRTGRLLVDYRSNLSAFSACSSEPAEWASA